MDFENVARQLANPSGKFGIKIGLGMNTMNEFISKTTYELLKIKDNDAVLEIGIGNGKFIKDIIGNATGISYTGIDISKTMITEAKRINRSLIEKENVDLFEAAIEEIPVWDESFDKICTVNTLYFWKDPIMALKEVYRVLKKGGIAVIAFRPFKKGQTLDFSKYGFKEYKREDFESLVEQTNFKIVDRIEVTEPEVQFNGEIHNLKSQYYLMQKVIHFQ